MKYEGKNKTHKNKTGYDFDFINDTLISNYLNSLLRRKYCDGIL